MNNDIKIGDKIFFTHLDTVKRNENFTTEVNINEVEIIGVYAFKDEPTKYLFELNGMNKTGIEEDFSISELDAIAKAKKKISDIEIYINGENIKTK